MSPQPNVIVLVADDHRYSSCAATGEPGVHTPALDRLIREGMCFDRAYTQGGLTAAVCVPSRACLMTGVNTFDAVRGRTPDEAPGLQSLNPRLPLLPEVFRANGYHTFATGKWHNDMASFNRCFADGAAIFAGGMGDQFALPLRPYDHTGRYPDSAVVTGDRHATDIFADTALNFLRGYTGAQPFFLYAAFTSPHDPRTPPEAFADMYDPQDPVCTPPPNAYPRHPFPIGDLDVRDELLADFPRTEAALRQHAADYYGMISHMDGRIGHILDCLHELHLADNTLVLYISDHGLALGQHGLMGKQNLYEHSLRIPCILRGPGIPAGVRAGQLVQHMDVFPTLCGLAGIPVPETVEGLSLFEGRTGDLQVPSQCLLTVYKHYQRSVLSESLKLIQHFAESGQGWALVYEQLFDIQSDPWETRNLAYDQRQQIPLEHLRVAMQALQQACGDPLPALRHDRSGPDNRSPRT